MKDIVSWITKGSFVGLVIFVFGVVVFFVHERHRPQINVELTKQVVPLVAPENRSSQYQLEGYEVMDLVRINVRMVNEGEAAAKVNKVVVAGAIIFPLSAKIKNSFETDRFPGAKTPGSGIHVPMATTAYLSAVANLDQNAIFSKAIPKLDIRLGPGEIQDLPVDLYFKEDWEAAEFSIWVEDGSSRFWDDIFDCSEESESRSGWSSSFIFERESQQ